MKLRKINSENDSDGKENSTAGLSLSELASPSSYFRERGINLLSSLNPTPIASSNGYFRELSPTGVEGFESLSSENHFYNNQHQHRMGVLKLNMNALEEDFEEEDDELLGGDPPPHSFIKNTDIKSKNSYADFTTIDWVRDHAKERRRQKKLKKMRQTYGKFRKWFSESVDACQGWFVVFLVGISSAFCAAFIGVGCDWLTDVRLGFCKSGFWLNKEFCCWTSTSNDGAHCENWFSWSDLFGISSQWINFLFYVFFSTLFATTSALLVKIFAPYAAGSGIAEVKTILGGFIIRRFLGVWTLLVKCVGLILSVASGLSLGKEGPAVHMACCCGNIFCRFFEKYNLNEAKKREILSAASAAGISVAFGAPLGGVMFSLEEVSYYFPHKTMWRTFFCALTAAVALQYLDPFRTGSLVMFFVTYNRPWHLFEIIPFALCGVLGGLYGALFNRCNVAWCRFKKKHVIFRSHPVSEVLIVSFVSSLLNYSNRFLIYSRTSLMKQLFSQCDPGHPNSFCTEDDTNVYWSLGFAALLSFLMTIFTVGLKVPAGVFVPTLAFGALYGRMIGTMIHNLVASWSQVSYFIGVCEDTQKCVTPGLYSMVGAAAALGGVTRMTVTLVVIMFELTGGLTYIVPIMVGVLVSKWVGDAIDSEAFYEMHIRLNGYPFLDNKIPYKHEYTAKDLLVESTDRLKTISVEDASRNTINHLELLMDKSVCMGFPVIYSDHSPTPIGYISRVDLQSFLDSSLDTPDVSGTTLCYFAGPIPPGKYLDCRHILDASPIIISDTTRMELVCSMFSKMGMRHVLVTRVGYLVGILTKKDIVRHIALVNNHDPNAILFH